MFTRCTARATRNVTPQRAGKPDCPELYSPRDWDSHSPCLPSASHPDCSCLLPAAQPLPAAGSSLPLCLLCFSFTAGLGDIILCWNIHVPNGCFSFAALVTFETTALNMNSVTCENLYMHILNMSHFIANIQSGGGMFVCLFVFLFSSLLVGARLFSSVSEEAVLSCLVCITWKQPSCWRWCIVHLWALTTAFCLSSSAMYFCSITSISTVTALLLWSVPSQSGLQSA